MSSSTERPWKSRLSSNAALRLSLLAQYPDVYKRVLQHLTDLPADANERSVNDLVCKIDTAMELMQESVMPSERPAEDSFVAAAYEFLDREPFSMARMSYAFQMFAEADVLFEAICANSELRKRARVAQYRSGNDV